MKKLLFSMLLLLMTAIGAVAQETLTVYDGTQSNSYVPFYGLYADTQGAASECVIPSDQLEDMVNGTITAMKFYISSSANAAWTGTHQVYIGEVDATTLSGIYGPSSFTVVKTASFDATGTELSITFDSPYTYGGGNLLIGTYVSVAGNYKGASFTGINQTENTAMYRSSGSGSATAVKFLPKTTFTYTPGAAPTCQKPTELAKSNLTAKTVDLAWVAGGEETEWQICLNGNEDNLTVATTNPYTLENLTPETAYTVKVRANCGSEQSRWSNTVSFTTLPSCPVPTELATSNLTARTVVLAWTAGGSETAWQICINNNEDDLVDVPENPYTLTGLTPATTYSIKVRANCGDTDGNSQWTSAVSFTTECEALTVDADHPYTEGFEDVTGSYAIPTCWERIVEYTSYGTTYPYVYSYGAHNGSKCLYMYSYPYYDTYENIIALPEMNSISTLQISLWAKASSTIPENFEIGYIKNGVFTSVQSFTLTTTYQQFTAYLNGAPADAEKIAIRAHHSSSSITVYVDDIEVSPMPTCIAPVDVVVSGITTNAASVSWTDVLPATAWQYQLNDSEIADAESNPINLTGLTANTEYTIKVRTACGEGEYSDWATVTFTTLCEAITIDAENPYTEDFESYTGVTYNSTNGVAPDCWEVSTTNSSNIAPHVIGSGSYYYVHGGEKALTFYGSGYCYAVLPIFTNDLTTLCVEFWSRMESVSYGTLTLGYITDGDNDMDSYVVLDTYTSTSTMTKQRTLLGTVPAEATRLVFRWYYSGQYSCCIDDLVVREASNAAEILTYSLPTQVSEATIGDGTIEVTVANSTDFDVDLTPTYTISENAEISAPTITGEGDVRTIAYTVTAEAGNTKDWTVNVTKAPISHDAFITAFTFAGQKAASEATIVSDTVNGVYTVNAVAEWNVDLTAIAPVITVSPAAEITPGSATTQDFSSMVAYTVTAEDGTTSHVYNVIIINDPDACVNPTDLEANGLTSHTATLNWLQAYTETAYIVKVSATELTDEELETATELVFNETVAALTANVEGLMLILSISFISSRIAKMQMVGQNIRLEQNVMHSTFHLLRHSEMILIQDHVGL